MPLLSIIIPVYNTEKYLSQCLDSIISQSFRDFEILLIDDGSKDNSGRICDHYSLLDKRIRVFHKDNSGVSSSRNLGLDNAIGEWVMFVDSDDLIPPQALASLMNCTDYNIDMALGGFRKFDETNEDIETVSFNDTGYLTIMQCIDQFIAPSNWVNDWQRYMVNRVFRLSIIKDHSLRFRTDIYYKEDGLFLIQYLSACSNEIMYFPNVVYLYRQVSNSAMNNVYNAFNPRLFTILDAHGEIYKIISNIKVHRSLRNRELHHLFHNYFWILDIMKRTNTLNKSNKATLRNRIIRNGGLFNYLYYVYFLHNYYAIKRRLSF